MAENNSSAPLLPCPFCGASARGYEIEPHQHSAALLALVPNMPKKHQGSYVIEGDCQCGSGLIGDNQTEVTARWNARAPQAVEAQSAPAAPDINRLRAEILEHASKGSRLVRTLFNEPTGTLSDVEVGDWIQRAQQYLSFATPAPPATGYSSAGDLAEVPDGFGSAEHWKEKAQYWAGVAHELRGQALRGEPVDGIIQPSSQAEVQAQPVAVTTRAELQKLQVRGVGSPVGTMFHPAAEGFPVKLYTAPQAQPAFQQRVQPWMMECFGPEISADRIERNHRFLEEALELVQATGCTQSEAHQLVDYVFGRPVGDPAQEVGGVMVTLAALCLANGLDMHQAGETELARVWTKVEAIRAKQAAKPKHSPLPQAQAQAQPADALDALKDIVGCIDAANSEGLDDALVNNTDARLTDLVQRRLLPAFYTAIAAQTACAAYRTAPTAANAKPADAQVREILCELVDQLERRARPASGNAPYHAHSTPGIWDDDNGVMSGKSCAWCALWVRAKEIRAAMAAAQEGGKA